jgi:chorismate mutase/prephenate dehydratase
MTRTTDGAPPQAAPPPSPAAAIERLQALRAQIDRIDLQVLALINERASLAGEIGRLKSEAGNGVFCPSREEEVLQNVLAANKGPLQEEALRAVFREIMSGARALQRVTTYAYLGPAYSYSHLAALERFGQSASPLQVVSIAAVFDAVARRHADYGVVPMDNSTEGGISDTLDQFIRHPQLRICSEVRVRIRHNLLANCVQPEIRRVCSKAQALGQCRNWLARNVPHAALVEVNSTAEAARLAAEEPGTAAVASVQAAARFGLTVLYTSIEDSPYNETRFAVIAAHDSERTGHDKTALTFQIAQSDRPGVLADALQIFKAHRVNLTWIDCLPVRTPKPEMVFFVDFEGHADDTKVKRTIAALHEHCEKVTVLGSFPIATPTES